MNRRLPANTVTDIEHGRRREIEAARSLSMRRHPASGALRTKADMSDETDVVEFKSVPTAQSHTVKLDQLWETLREAERLGKNAWYVVEFDGIKLQGRITRG